MPEEASGYLNGVAHGGSSSSTASATQGSRVLSKSGSAPSLVEAAAVKLENQRLREEIRAMCSTIKSQSSQLSELWAETQRLQARKNGKRCRMASNVSNLMAGVAELSRMQLDPGNASGARPEPGRAGFPHSQSAGSLVSAVGLSSADTERGVSGWSGALGQPTQPGPGHLRPQPFEEVSHMANAEVDPIGGTHSAQVLQEEAPNSKGMRDGTIAQFRHIPSHFSDLISQDDTLKGGLPPTLASNLYKHSFDGRSGQSQKRLFTPKITPLPESYRYTLDRAAQNGVTATFGKVGHASTPNLRFAADASGTGTPQLTACTHSEPAYGAVTQDVAGPRLAANTAGTNRLGILEPTTLAKKEPEQASRGAVSLFIMAQNLNLSMLSAKSELAASFRSIIQEDIARELGPGFTSEHVDVRLLAESAAIPVTITAPSGVSCHDLHRWLCNKPLRWGATDATGAGGGNTLATLVSQGFSAVCLSPSWCLCTIGMPSIVADEASTTVSGGSPLDGKMRGLGLSQDLPAVPDEQDLILPRSLQRSGHTPRDAAKPPRASPKRRPMAKAPFSSAKVKRNPREAKPNRENSSARQLNFSGLSDTPYYQPMLLGEGFGEENEHINGLFVPSVDTSNFDSRVNSPQLEERSQSRGVNGVVTQPNKRPMEISPKTEVAHPAPAFSKQNSSDEEVTFIEDDSVSTPAAPRRIGSLASRRSGVEQPTGGAAKRFSTRSRTSSSHSAGQAPAPKLPAKVEPKAAAPAPEAERPSPPVPVVPVSASLPTTSVEHTSAPEHTASDVPAEKTAAEVEPKPKTEVFQAEAASDEDSESSEDSEADSEDDNDDSADGVTQARPRRQSTSADVKALIGDVGSTDSDSEEVERSEIPTRTRAESLLSKE